MLFIKSTENLSINPSWCEKQHSIGFIRQLDLDLHLSHHFSTVHEMEAILGIVAGFLGPAIDLGKCIAEPVGSAIKRQLNYLCCFNNNVLNLENESKKLEEARYEAQSKVNTAQNKAEIVVPQVQTWLQEVSEIQHKMLEIDDKISTTRNGGRSKFGCRYSLSKKVKKMVEAMKELRESGSFTTISHPPPPAAMASIRLRSTFEFDSRKHVEEKIMVSLRDEGTNMVGICGMGGVGKTTMAKTIMHRARTELGFEETVMAVVSQDVDKLKIQDDIAKSLGLPLSAGSLSSKAHELRTRLKAGTRKSLVFIDDVWEKLELEELGIPCNSGCKVLITSRNSHILEAMDVEKLHAVQVLSETEAWELFKSKVGSCIEQENVISVARQVVDECKGLPIALITVGVALKDKASIPSWNNALHQLKSSNPRHMPEVIKYVYQPIRLSYDLLETDEHKSLFLLCCLFPEDHAIPIRNLVVNCMGLHMYEDATSLEQARDTTCFLVDRLKSRFLLLEGGNENHVKMHDVVRDVGIFIASEEKRIKCNECTWISPFIGERNGALGGSSLFPNLHLLWINRQRRVAELENHDDFLEGMSELNVFSLEYPSLRQIPPTIGLLKKLRALVLEECVCLESIYVVGELVNLEIFIVRWCNTIECLPVEIGRLSRLRLLELSQCRNLKRIAPGIISNLIELEELIVECFGGWEGRNVEAERKNAPLSELEHLSSLTSLTITVNDSGLAAEQLRLSPKMLKFHISIGYSGNFMDKKKYETTMSLRLPENITLGKWIQECVRSVESICLEGDGGSRVLDLRVAQNLRELIIRNCSTVKKLMNTPFPLLKHLCLEKLSELEEIIRGDIQHNLDSIFSNLSSITIIGCGRLRSLFSLSMMEGIQLEKLVIRDCEMMEQVLMWNEEEENQTNIHIPLLFPKLESIELDSLPNLTSFIKGIEVIKFSQLAKFSIVKCPLLNDFVCSISPDDHHCSDRDYIHFFCKPQEVTFDYLSRIVVDGGNDNVRGSWCPQIPIDSFARLCDLKVSGYQGMKSLFSTSMMMRGSSLLQLERLEIERCDMMEQVFLQNEEEDNQTNSHIPLVFKKLKFIKLSSLPSLHSFVKGIEGIEFPQLAEISVDNCPRLKGFVCSGSPNDHLDGDDDSIHLFCKSEEVKFEKLSKLKVDMERNLCLQTPIGLFTGLLELRVSGFIGVKSLFSFSRTKSSCLFLLEMLEICQCDMMEQIILWNDEQNQTDIHINVFPKLKLLVLENLPKLKSLSKGIESIQFPVPAHMHISNCPLLESCVSTTAPIDDNDDYIHLFCKPHKVECEQLKELQMGGSSDDKMRRNWCPQIPMIDLFAGLCELSVWNLKGMESLFPCSIARMMQNIKYLYISRCEEMVTVIEDDDACGAQTPPPILLFPNLEILRLYDLPKLRSFCECRCALHMPSLWYLAITKCDMMEELTSEPLNIPNLGELQIDYLDINNKDLRSVFQLNRIRKEEERKTLLKESEEEEEIKQIQHM